jgi:hypothetical protein
VTGVLEQRIVPRVAGISAAQHHEDVEVSVAVPVGHRDPVSLLEMAGARRLGDVLKASSLDVLEQDIGHQAVERHPAGPEIDIEEPIVVDVAEIHPHRGDWMNEPDLLADIAKSLPLKVAKEVGMAKVFELHAHVVGDGLGQ